MAALNQTANELTKACQGIADFAGVLSKTQRDMQLQLAAKKNPNNSGHYKS